MVDRLAVRVVVDAYHDALARTAEIGNVEVQRFGLALGTGLQRHLHNEHGLSLHLESQRGGERRNILLDFGFTPTPLFNNLEILKIDAASIDALIVSHGHFDHFDDLVPLLRRDRTRMRKDLALYAGGEDTFCYRWIQLPDSRRQQEAEEDGQRHGDDDDLPIEEGGDFVNESHNLGLVTLVKVARKSPGPLGASRHAPRSNAPLKMRGDRGRRPRRSPRR